jgi:hypothetical protein
LLTAEARNGGETAASDPLRAAGIPIHEATNTLAAALVRLNFPDRSSKPVDKR